MKCFLLVMSLATLATIFCVKLIQSTELPLLVGCRNICSCYLVVYVVQNLLLTKFNYKYTQSEWLFTQICFSKNAIMYDFTE